MSQQLPIRRRRPCNCRSNPYSTRRQNANETILIPDTPNTPSVDETCIDLTKDEDDIIEVTTVQDTSVVCLGEPETRTVSRLQDSLDSYDPFFDNVISGIMNQSFPIQNQDDYSLSSNLFPSPSPLNNFGSYNQPYSLRPNARFPPPLNRLQSPVPDDPPTLPPPGSPKPIACAVCLEDHNQIRSGGKQLMSTTCGHLFCKPCIHEAFKVKHNCPSCRKKITMKQIHPIYI